MLPSIAKPIRCGIGAKIDTHFLELLETIFAATYTPHNKKFALIVNAVNALDLLKFLAQILWENKAINDKQYSKLSEQLFEIGRMLAGWKKFIEQKTPPNNEGENN